MIGADVAIECDSCGAMRPPSDFHDPTEVICRMCTEGPRAPFVGADPTCDRCGCVLLSSASKDAGTCADCRCRSRIAYEGVEDDPVERPGHYTHGPVEVIDIIEGFDLGYRLGNVVKYLLRHRLKGNPLQDLRKARWYLDREIQELEGGR